MSPENEQLIRESWKLLEPQAAQFAGLFYDRLFEMDPQVRALFATTDMDRQRVKFVDMLRVLVKGMDDPAHLVSEVAASGRRHADYGAQDAHYGVVGAALLWAIEQGMGDRFDHATRDAWRELYTLISAVMRRGAERARAAQASLHRA